MKHERLIKAINKAYSIADHSTHKHKMGAVIVDRFGRILSTGFNKQKSHPTMLDAQKPHNKERIFLHAEVDAINKCFYSTKGATMIVVRKLKNGTMGMSKPCSGCMDMLMHYGFKEVLYVENNGDTILTRETLL